MKNNIKYGIIILLFFGCKSEQENSKFSGEFNGYWAETFWQYKFYSNNEFDFKSEGHYPMKPRTTILAYFYIEDGKWKRRKH